VITALAFFFCIYNGALQAFSVLGYYDETVELSKQYNLYGLILFAVGMIGNMHSDYYIISLKRKHKGYQIPKQGLFLWVSAPNYLCEIIEWFGYVIFMKFSIASIAFWTYTVSNIGPRAFQNHRWYQNTFKDDYPKNRKALIPYVL